MNKKLFISILTILAGFVLLAVGSANAAPNESAVIGPYEGQFVGTVYGDGNSSAPLTLDLTHRGDDIEGTVTIGNGLYANGRYCGKGYIPAGTQYAVGQTGKTDHHLVADAGFTVTGIKIDIDVNGNLSANGEHLTATAKVDLPFLCGRDINMQADLTKVAEA